MSYSLEFKESALKEWKKLDGAIREQFKKKLVERLTRASRIHDQSPLPELPHEIIPP